MYRKLRTLSLIATLLAAALPAYSQTPEPAPVITLQGREDLPGFGPLSFQVQANGKVVMIDATKKPVQGDFRMDDGKAIFTFANCVYQAVEDGGALVGQARFTTGADAGKQWNFRVAMRPDLRGQTFSGREALEGYGDLTFRFLDDTAVEMLDRDGTTRGTYAVDGSQATLTFAGCIYRGEVRGREIVGHGCNHNAQWSFTVAVKK